MSGHTWKASHMWASLDRLQSQNRWWSSVLPKPFSFGYSPALLQWHPSDLQWTPKFVLSSHCFLLSKFFRVIGLLCSLLAVVFEFRKSNCLSTLQMNAVVASLPAKSGNFKSSRQKSIASATDELSVCTASLTFILCFILCFCQCCTCFAVSLFARLRLSFSCIFCSFVMYYQEILSSLW